MSTDTKLIGNISELAVMLYVTKLGYQVSTPYGDRARYDQIWDINGKLLKVQIKTSHLNKNGTVTINCHSTNREEGKTKNRRYTEKEIDGIATIFNNKCYFIPIKEVPSRAIKLRFNQPANNQNKDIHYLVDYEVEAQLQKI